MPNFLKILHLLFGLIITCLAILIVIGGILTPGSLGAVMLMGLIPLFIGVAYILYGTAVLKINIFSIITIPLIVFAAFEMFWVINFVPPSQQVLFIIVFAVSLLSSAILFIIAIIRSIKERFLPAPVATLPPLAQMQSQPHVNTVPAIEIPITRKDIQRGLLYSFLISVVNLLGIVALFFIGGGMMSAFIFLSGSFKELYPYQIFNIIVSFILTTPFLLLNTIILLFSKNKGQRRGLLFGYLFFFIIFLIPFIYIFPVNKVASEQFRHLSAYDTATEQDTVAGCLSAKEEKLFPDDQEISKDICLFNLAMKKNDASICDTIADNAAGAFTKDSCKELIAEKSENASACNTLKNKDQCYFNAALSNYKISYCDNIDPNLLYHGGYPSAQDLMASYNNYLRDSCYTYFFGKTGTSVEVFKTYCPSIKDNGTYEKYCEKVTGAR
ncbi:MAG: hypothetical protein EXS52_02230 [Candidatus Staskawiczbacteria bacterium]|nr:hypothetical protein [Candidatus Staskawiczbacteria bacterium]